MTDKTCKTCGAPINNPRKQTYCSRACQRKHEKDVYGLINRYKWAGIVGNGEKISTGSSGAIGELAVSAFLLSHGWAVFRSISSASLVDLVAIRNKTIVMIEVRKGLISRSFQGTKEFNFSRGRGSSHEKESLCDVYAVVLPDMIAFVPNDGLKDKLKYQSYMKSLDSCLSHTQAI